MSSETLVSDSREAPPAPLRRRPVRWKLLLPAEHGSWSLVLEPVVFAAVVASRPAPLALGVAVVLAFLARQPLKLARPAMNRRYPEAVVASVILVSLAVAALAATVAWAGREPLAPLVPAALVAVVQLRLDLTRRGRSVGAEVGGAIAPGFAATAMLLAGGVPAPTAWLTGSLLSLRGAGSVLLVRHVLRSRREAAHTAAPAIVLHLATIACAAGLVWLGVAAPALAAITLLLLARCLWELRRRAPEPKPVQIGVREIVWGLVFVFAGTASMT